MISNMIRIVTTACCYYYIKGEAAHGWAHDISGWLMMPLALVLVGLELQILKWLTSEKAEDEDDRRPVLPVFSMNAARR